MTIPGLFKEYIWLIETINRYGKITFAEFFHFNIFDEIR